MGCDVMENVLPMRPQRTISPTPGIGGPPPPPFLCWGDVEDSALDKAPCPRFPPTSAETRRGAKPFRAEDPIYEGQPLRHEVFASAEAACPGATISHKVSFFDFPHLLVLSSPAGVKGNLS